MRRRRDVATHAEGRLMVHLVPPPQTPGEVLAHLARDRVFAIAGHSGLTLRSWRPGDVDALLRHADNRKVWRNLTDAFPYPYTREEAEHWLGTPDAQWHGAHFAIALGDVPVGGCGAIPLSGMERFTANVGYWLGEAVWGRGIATAALRELTRLLLDESSLERLQAHVYEWNPGSMRVLEKNGYAREGWLRRSVVKDGHLIDRAIYARLRSEPLADRIVT